MHPNCLFLFLFLSFFLLNSTVSAVLVRVDCSGNADFTGIQAAVDSAVPANNSGHVFILVLPGVYREKVTIPPDKPFVTISGTAAGEVTVTWPDSGDIFRSPTFSVLADDFIARYLTIQNSYGVGAKAVALRVSGDRAAFVSCRIVSRQDTLLDDRGRHYYAHSYIEGDIDFIFGNGASFFEKCHIHSVAQGGGAMTAQRRQTAAEATGFTFLNCKITGAARRSAVLGRPWAAFSRVVFARTYMSAAVLPQGWDDWGNFSNHKTVYYGEYRCYGAGSGTAKRVKWSRALSKSEAAPYLTGRIFGGTSWIRSAMSRFPRANIHRPSGNRSW